MGQILSVYKYVADRDHTVDESPSPSSEADPSTFDNKVKTSRPTGGGAIAESINSLEAPVNHDQIQKIATLQAYYIDATKILIEMADRDFSVNHVVPYAAPPMFTPPVPYINGDLTNQAYLGPPIYAQMPPPSFPGLHIYSSPYNGAPIPPQGEMHAVPSMTYNSPYTDSGPNVDNTQSGTPSKPNNIIPPVPTAQILKTQGETKSLSGKTPVRRGTKRKRASDKGKSISKSQDRIIDHISISSSSSDEAIEAQKDMFEKTGKLYPQTLSQIDALLTMANGGVLPGPPTSSNDAEVDIDATESDSEPANGTMPRPQLPVEAEEDAQVVLIVDRIMDDILALRDWQAVVPPGTYRQAMLADERGLFLASELKRLVGLARPLVNIV
ncbi:hypothetical protein P7C71_g3300, partial [Lecanoromycetidae sp. Uapishka_2]